jgi:peptidyl-tRNA hydrolase, PTH1 family
MNFLIVGLGNIGSEYAHTKHNIGFDVVDDIATDASARFTTERYGDVVEIRVKNHILILLKPSTYMNLSGHAVRYWMQFKKISLENVLVVVDDLALPFGTLRMRPGGSDAGHNGLKHIKETLGTDQYARLRFGIGNDFSKGHQVEYVLSGWSSDQLKSLPERITLAGEIVKSFCLNGIQQTMNLYNKR